MQGRIGVGGSGVGGGPHNLRLQDTEAPPPSLPTPPTGTPVNRISHPAFGRPMAAANMRCRRVTDCMSNAGMQAMSTSGCPSAAGCPKTKSANMKNWLVRRPQQTQGVVLQFTPVPMVDLSRQAVGDLQPMQLRQEPRPVHPSPSPPTTLPTPLLPPSLPLPNPHSDVGLVTF